MDTQQVQAGKVVKVGIGQLSNPTPTAAKIIFRVFLYLSGLWALLAPALTNIPADVLANINKCLLIGNTIMNFTIQFFGWDTPTSKQSTDTGGQ